MENKSWEETSGLESTRATFLVPSQVSIFSTLEDMFWPPFIYLPACLTVSEITWTVIKRFFVKLPGKTDDGTKNSWFHLGDVLKCGCKLTRDHRRGTPWIGRQPIYTSPETLKCFFFHPCPCETKLGINYSFRLVPTFPRIIISLPFRAPSACPGALSFACTNPFVVDWEALALAKLSALEELVQLRGAHEPSVLS